MGLKQELQELRQENIKLQGRLAEIKNQLVYTLPIHKYEELKRHQAAVGHKIVVNNAKITELKEELRECLAEAFMETTIRMFDPVDISEIWDRVYAENPHLKRG